MKKERAFTLAELLAVIIILGVIALIVFPVVNRSIKQSRQKVYEEQKNIILKSAKNWSVDNVNELSFTDDTFLTLDQLMRDGYIEKKKVINPNTDKEMNGCVVISYNNTYNHFDYDYTDVSCEEMQDKPIITLNGENKVVVGIGQTYTDAGASATYKGEDISSSIKITNNVNTSIAGSYEVTYNVIYNGKNAKEVIRTVIVMDKNPVITLSPKQTNKYEKSVTVGVSATVVEGNTISSMKYRLDGGTEQNVTNDKIVININGEHTIEVTVVDNEGNRTTTTSGIYKIDNTPPTITFAEGDAGVTLNVSEALSYNLLTGVTVSDNDPSVTIDDVVTSGSLSAVVGEYKITYKVVDEAGNETTKVRTIIVTTGCDTVILGKNITSGEVVCQDPDSNPRYVGADPDNYVQFNGELWRIIGKFDGQVKIMRDEYLSNSAWDTNGGTEWSTSTANTELNATFLETIDATSQSYIDKNHLWDINSITSYSNRELVYNEERGKDLETSQKTTWTGAIGLMYSSDYLYSTEYETDDVTESWIYETYYQKIEIADLDVWTDFSYNYPITYVPWMMSTINSNALYLKIIDPISNEDYDIAGYISDLETSITLNVEGIIDVDCIFEDEVSYRVMDCSDVMTYEEYQEQNMVITPTLYLNENVFIETGTGTSTDPYILDMETIEDDIVAKADVSDLATNDPDGNLRYVGQDPDNYVSFNGELWRIIGVFDGQAKIIQDYYYSTVLMWDSTSYTNNWATASLKEELNDGENSFLSSIQTQDTTSYNYIDLNHKWNIGGPSTYADLTRSEWYNVERSDNISSAMTSKTWIGAIGLVYPSDFGYATSISDAECDTLTMNRWSSGTANCESNIWLANPDCYYEWTLTPLTSTGYDVMTVYSTGDISIGINSPGGTERVAVEEMLSRSVLYLKYDVRIVDGTGDRDDPFKLGA